MRTCEPSIRTTIGEGKPSKRSPFVSPCRKSKPDNQQLAKKTRHKVVATRHRRGLIGKKEVYMTGKKCLDEGGWGGGSPDGDLPELRFLGDKRRSFSFVYGDGTKSNRMHTREASDRIMHDAHHIFPLKALKVVHTKIRKSSYRR